MTSTDGEPLWEFALALYSSPGVEETALHLQDTLGVNINVLLWACWLETRKLRLTPALLQHAESSIAAWDCHVVQVLRRLRQDLKAYEVETATELRASVKEAEILAERQCLAMLQTIELAAPEADLDLGQNMAFYLDSFNGTADSGAIRQALGRFRGLETSG